jgi:anti-sigma factor RsiW
MTPCGPHRVALASYALGVLDEVDSEQLEVHLGGCDECAGELADLLPTAGELAMVDRDAFIRSEISGVTELPTRQPRAVNRRPRRSRLGWRLPVSVVAAAAAVVVVGAVLLLFPHPSEPSRPGVAGGAGTSTAASRAAPLGVLGGGASAAQFQSTDPGTGARLELTVTSKRWGSHLAMSLSNVRGPLRCRLVVTDLDGHTEVVSSWQVPPDGYGTPAHPAPLELQTDSYLSIAGISQVEVQTVGQDGTVSTRLVALRP